MSAPCPSARVTGYRASTQTDQVIQSLGGSDAREAYVAALDTFADRIALRLKPGHQAAEVKIASGDVAAAWAGHEEVLLRLDAWRKQPGGAPWGQLETLVRDLNGHPAVAEARLVRIDWVAEADLIKANSPK